MAQYSRIIGRRTLKPILWNLILQSSLLSVFIFVTNASFFHPFKWIYDWYFTFVRQGFWLYMLPLTVMVVLLASASTEDYIKIQPFYSNRISLIQQALTPHNILIGFLHLFIGFLIPWAYSSLLGVKYEKFTYSCLYLKEEYCFSEKRLFLIEAGMWISLLYFFHSHFFGTRYLKFPIVQLPKFILIKSLFLETFQRSIQWITLPLVSFVIMYYMKFGSLTLAVAEKFGYKIEEDRLNTISGVFDVSLIMYSIVFSILVAMTIRFMEMFSRVYLTARLIFPFQPLPDSEIPSLTEGLKMKDYPIIQHLAFLDLMLLSQNNKVRREEIFKLSSFGGHPHLWNAVKEGCVDIIYDFIEDLDRNVNSYPQLVSAQQKTQTLLRRNVPDYFTGFEKSLNTTMPKEEPPQTGFFSYFAEKIMKSPIIAFVFGSRKDMEVRHILRLSLPIKWACESLSFLSCHSLQEDKYGILINDLPDIIVLILQLKNSLENFLKRSALATSLSHQDLENIAEVTALKKSVKRSIYRIVNTFKNHISDLQLSKDIENQLMPFIMYRE